MEVLNILDLGYTVVLTLSLAPGSTDSFTQTTCMTFHKATLDKIVNGLLVVRARGQYSELTVTY